MGWLPRSRVRVASQDTLSKRRTEAEPINFCGSQDINSPHLGAAHALEVPPCQGRRKPGRGGGGGGGERQVEETEWEVMLDCVYMKLSQGSDRAQSQLYQGRPACQQRSHGEAEKILSGV